MTMFPTTAGDHSLSLSSTIDGSEQPFRLFIPTAIRNPTPLPLVVVLHGKGVDHNAWFEKTPIAEFAERFGYLVAAPNGRGEDYYRDEGEQDVLDIMALIRKNLNVDENRVYLAGHSMGGWGTWYIALRHPELFSAICPMSAPVPFELLPAARNLSPLIIHDADDDVISVQQSRDAAKRLADLGVSFQYREEHGYGHSSRMIGDNLQRVFDWFAKRSLAQKT